MEASPLTIGKETNNYHTCFVFNFENNKQQTTNNIINHRTYLLFIKIENIIEKTFKLPFFLN